MSESDLILLSTRTVLEPRGARTVLMSSCSSSLEDKDRHSTTATSVWLRFASGLHSGQTEKRPM